jgi:hypothetical protein
MEGLEGLNIEELFIRAKKLITKTPHVRSVRVTTSSVRSLLRELRLRLESRGYMILRDRYEPVEGDSEFREVLGVIIGKKGGEKMKINPFLIIGLALIVLGIVAITTPFGILLLVVGAIALVYPRLSGMRYYIPGSKHMEGLIIVCEGIESSGVRKREIKLQEDVSEVKGVDLAYRVAELNFIVGGTNPDDVEDTVRFLERYKAMA